MIQRYVADPVFGLVPADQFYAEKHAQQYRAQSGLACPRVVTDTMAPVQSQLDGKLYDSKSTLRATYRAAGVVEVGNDTAALKPKSPPKPDRRQIRASLASAFSKAGLGA